MSKARGVLLKSIISICVEKIIFWDKKMKQKLNLHMPRK